MLSEGKLKNLTTDITKIPQQGARYFTKFVLFPVRLIFTLDHPETIGSNRDAIKYFCHNYFKDRPEVIKLINTAYDARNYPANHPIDISINLLTTALVTLYRYCIDRYLEAVTTLSDAELMAKLAHVQTRLNNHD